MKENSAGSRDAAGRSGLALAAIAICDRHLRGSQVVHSRSPLGGGQSLYWRGRRPSRTDYLLAEAASVVLKRVRSRDPELHLTLNEGQMVIAATRVSPIQFHETRSLIDPAFALAQEIGAVPLRRPVHGLGSAARRPACHRRCKAIQKDAGKPTCRPGTLGGGSRLEPCGPVRRSTTVHGSLSKYALLSDAATASCLPSGLQARP